MARPRAPRPLYQRSVGRGGRIAVSCGEWREVTPGRLAKRSPPAGTRGASPRPAAGVAGAAWRGAGVEGGRLGGAVPGEAGGEVVAAEAVGDLGAVPAWGAP